MYCTKYLGTKYLKVVIKNEFGISGWLVIFFANGFPILLLGRLLMGLGIGLSQPTTMLQLSEISLIRFRGTLGIMGALFSNGSFIFSLVGTYHTYKIKWKLCIISIIMRKTRSYLGLGGYMFTFLVHFGFNGTYHFISDIIILSTRISTLAYEKRENIWGRRCNVEIKGP